MKCVILAAGEGSRLKGFGVPKPLTPFLGLSLIERVILTAVECGINEFIVVLGHEGSKVEEHLKKISASRNIQITTVTNEDWIKGNGGSLLSARSLVVETFLLLMSDHIFERTALERIIHEEIGEDEIILAVDHNKNNSLVDYSDTTKVSIIGGRITDIGKTLADYDAIDTGMFKCSTAIFDAADECIKNGGDNSVSGAVKIIADKGKMKTCDITGLFWIDVDDKPAYHKAEKALLKKMGKQTDGIVSKHLNRPISTFISKYLVKTSMTPNTISLASFFMCFIATALFVAKFPFNLLFGGVLTQLASIIDGCDGEIARLKHTYTGFGKWFDAVLDRYADGLLISGLTYNLYTTSAYPYHLSIGFLALIGSFVNSYTAEKYDKFLIKNIENNKFVRVGRDLRLFIIFVGAIFNEVFFVLFALAVVMNMENIRRILLLYSQSVSQKIGQTTVG